MNGSVKVEGSDYRIKIKDYLHTSRVFNVEGNVKISETIEVRMEEDPENNKKVIVNKVLGTQKIFVSVFFTDMVVNIPPKSRNQTNFLTN